MVRAGPAMDSSVADPSGEFQWMMAVQEADPLWKVQRASAAQEADPSGEVRQAAMEQFGPRKATDPSEEVWRATTEQGVSREEQRAGRWFRIAGRGLGRGSGRWRLRGSTGRQC